MKERKLKIFFIMPALNGGGAERVISILLSEIDKSRFECYLLLLKKEGKFLNDIPKEVTVFDLNCKKVRHSIFKIVKLAHKFRPDIIFTGIIHLSMMVMIFKVFFPRHCRFVARETTILSIHADAMEKRPWLLKWLVRNFYSGFNTIISQSAQMKSDLVENFGLSGERITIIANPIDVDKITGMAKGKQIVIDSSYLNILAIGRLSYEKGVDLLLEAFHLLKRDTHRVILNILGTGEEESSLKQLAHKLSISDSVKFLGFSDNPYPIISAVNVVVLSSRYDGFPNTVLESIACGVPVVAFDCPGGVSEIVMHGINGWIVPPGDVSALSDSIKMALHQTYDKEAIRKTLVPKFESKSIVKRFEGVFQEVANQSLILR